ncbi:sigma factor [Virgibacillus sp. MSJ-26]|uniref:sigma factor n=1 Tax=Virgibacillus sp. MSJ-26 TaxID=2841522 RepID=UPI0035302CE9
MTERYDLKLRDLLMKNKQRIYYQLHTLSINDTHQEYYQEGLVAMWNAYRTYHADKGLLATYFNYTIRYRLIDLLCQENRHKEKKKQYLQHMMSEMDKRNFLYFHSTCCVLKSQHSTLLDTLKWLNVKANLTENQWKWVKYYMIEGFSIRNIAAQENVSTDAVKSWGRDVRKKLGELWDLDGDEDSWSI